MNQVPLLWEVGKMKNKHIVGMMAAGIAILFILSCMPVQAGSDSSFVVYGQISVGTTKTNGIVVTVRNIVTGEEITATSKTDSFGNKGVYSVNLGNLPSGWTRNETHVDEIRISCTNAGNTKTETFEIPEAGTMYKQDVSIPAPAGGGGGTETGVLGTGGSLAIPIFIIFFVILGAALFLYGSSNSSYVPPATKRKKKK